MEEQITATERSPERTQAVEDYVKAIWMLLEDGQEPTGQAIARRLNVSQASVTSMLRRLAELGLVRYERYRTVELTDAGRLVALEIVRHHRLLELFLSEMLGMGWEHVHDEAEVLEHHISERLEDLIAARLGDPQFDPHGHPIPARDGTLPRVEHVPLTQLSPGTSGRIAQVREERAEVLAWLAAEQLSIGTTIEVVDVQPHAGTVTVAVDDGSKTSTLGAALAARIDITSPKDES